MPFLERTDTCNHVVKNARVRHGRGKDDVACDATSARAQGFGAIAPAGVGSGAPS